jgi:hypothetical protein
MENALQKLQMEPLVNKAIKGAAVGAGIGLCWWVGKQLMPTAPETTPFRQISADANQLLASDPEIRVLCERFKLYARFDEESYAQLLLNWSYVINLYVQLCREEIKPKMSHPRLVAGYCSQIVEAIRTLRAVVAFQTKNNPSSLRDFDEIAADFQRNINQYTHNVTKTVEYLQIQQHPH